MNHKGRPNFTAYSAGSHPSGAVRPEAMAQLERAQLPTGGLRSKSWGEFAQPGAPKLDFVFTVCDNAANEVCPIWPGQPMTAHWGVADPAAVRGSASAIEHAYRDAFATLDRRIGLFLSLPLADIDELAIKKEIDKIGNVTTGLATTGPATTSPATTSPATTGPATTGPATIGRE
jgi:arsenate reductase